MADKAFRTKQKRERYAPHVRAINDMVDGLRGRDGRGWVPYVAPWHGGIEARVLSVLRDPGRMTQDGVGSGFLCIENDDRTAERQCRDFARVKICARAITPWNAYPWYIDRAPTAVELEAGLDPLMRVIELLPRLTAVLLQGRDAQNSWDRLVRRSPRMIGRRGLVVVRTYHPSPQALRHPDPAVRAARVQDRLRAYQRVAGVLKERVTSAPTNTTMGAPG